ALFPLVGDHRHRSKLDALDLQVRSVAALQNLETIETRLREGADKFLLEHRARNAAAPKVCVSPQPVRNRLVADDVRDDSPPALLEDSMNLAKECALPVGRNKVEDAVRHDHV